MKYTLIRELYKSNIDTYQDKEIEIAGWVRTIRSSKNFGFIELNDGSFFKNLQIVFDNTLSNYEEITKVSIASSLIIKGTIVKTENAKQPFEMHAKNIEVYNLSDKDYPIQKKNTSFEFLRTQAHLRPRTNTFSAVFRVRSLLSYSIHKFFQERDFVYVHTPIITGSDAEGAGEMFNVTTLEPNKATLKDDKTVDYSQDFFGKNTHLTVSGQLEGETYASALRNIYTFGPTFRAENSNTVKHAAEFWMIEPEMSFADLTDCLDIAEEMIKYCVSYVLEKAPEEIEFFDKFIAPGLKEKLNTTIEKPFARITYTDAIKELEKNNDNFEYKVSWGADIQTEHERYISEKIFGRPTFITNYPAEIKAFYMKQNDDGKTVAASDLVVPGIGELIGGSQREDDYTKLKTKMDSLNMNPEEYWWYMDLRKYGSVPHSGFGIGFERFMMYVTGMLNIRDVIPFPRTPKNCEF